MKRLIWNRYTKTLIRHIAGWSFIVLGVLGIFLPVLQGLVFLLIGAVLLAPDVPFFRHLLDRLHEKVPGFHELSERLHHRFHGKKDEE